MTGYHGRYFRIDVSTGEARAINIGPDVLRSFVGGVGLGTWLLLRESQAGFQPLLPPAPLIFVFSPLVGSPLTTSAKFAVVSKSPLTDRINDSLCSSRFAIRGKATGYDALVIVGRADHPSLLCIDERGARLLPAAHLWGDDIPTTESRIRSELSDSYSAAVIGPAGERLVRYATISHDGRHAGRGGAGAVMGSKQLKAVAVSGNQRLAAARPDQLQQYARDLVRRSLGPSTAKYRELGTVSNVGLLNRLHALPTRNFHQGTFENAANVSGEQLHGQYERLRASCAACTIGCEHQFYPRTNSSDTAVRPTRLEYENLFALGPLCGIDDLEMIRRASQLCDDMGMDAISSGATLAFAMECRQQGLGPADGPAFGDASAMIQWLHQIVDRQGWGDDLAEGSRRAAQRLGSPATSWAMHVKGLELPGYEPRAMRTMALGYAVGTRGADHNRSGAYQVDLSAHGNPDVPRSVKVEQAADTELLAAAYDSLILCKFLRGALESADDPDRAWRELATMWELVTDWPVTATELRETARRIVDVRKWFNQREGWTPSEDWLPDRFFESGTEGSAPLDRDEMRGMIDDYYRLQGWSEGWVPQERTTKWMLEKGY